MRNLSTVEIERIKVLTEHSVELTLLEPTETGLKKSILDATGSVRSFLKSQGLHDYNLQSQGPENKVQLNSYFIEQGILLNSIASLYRPKTKQGDPRIWFKGLTGYCSPNDILGLLAYNQTLYIVNLTRLDIKSILNEQKNNPLKELIDEISKASNFVADELLQLLRKIALRGPIPASVNADTAIGRTLESLLGIAINSSKSPDYKGIELKSFRDNRKNRKNLFAQVPDWPVCKLKSSAEILNHFGYKRGDDFKLYCTVSSIIRNSQGLMLKVDTRTNYLIENSDRIGVGDFVIWTLQTLHKRLLEKHNETFWIAADSLLIDGVEHFKFKKVEHTKKPIVSQFDILLEQGIITLDHLIKKAPNGKVVEKGPLFKIKPSGIALLFPPSKTYNLCE